LHKRNIVHQVVRDMLSFQTLITIWLQHYSKCGRQSKREVRVRCGHQSAKRILFLPYCDGISK